MTRVSQAAHAATLPGVNSPRPFPTPREQWIADEIARAEQMDVRRSRAENYLRSKGVDPYCSGPSPRLIDWITGLAMLGVFLAFGATYLIAGAVG